MFAESSQLEALVAAWSEVDFVVVGLVVIAVGAGAEAENETGSGAVSATAVVVVTAIVAAVKVVAGENVVLIPSVQKLEMALLQDAIGHSAHFDSPSIMHAQLSADFDFAFHDLVVKLV